MLWLVAERGFVPPRDDLDEERRIVCKPDIDVGYSTAKDRYISCDMLMERTKRPRPNDPNENRPWSQGNILSLAPST